MKKITICLALVLAAAAAFSLGGKKGSIGVFASLGGSGLIGASYQADDRLDLRAALGLDLLLDPNEFAYKTTRLQPLALSLDALYRLPLTAGLDFSLGPRVAFELVRNSYEYPTYTNTESSVSAGLGALGEIRCLLNGNLGLFLDASLSATFLSYSYLDSSGAPSTGYTSTRIQTGTSLGLVFFIH